MPNTDPRLHPEVRTLLAEIEALNSPPVESLPVAEARTAVLEGLGTTAGMPEPVGNVENRRIPGLAGDIPVRIYTPAGRGPFPALLYFHGGGWVLCNLDTHDVGCRAIANRAGAVVVAVDYRLAPEHPYPAAVDDCYAATSWMAANAAALNVDAARISVGGDSAGGNLAAVLALKSRDENGPRIALQILVYPVTDLSSFDTPSYQEFADGYHLTKSEMEWFRRCYVPNPENALQPYASPLLAKDLRHLPPALVITAECDVLRDEGEAYAERLRDAGVPVICTRYRGMIHPFFTLLGAVGDGWKAVQQVADAIRGIAAAAQ